jgi:serine acetyltransferase
VLDRDPACERLIEPFLYFKGFHAIQTHRLAHWLWTKGRADFALYLQSRSSDVFQTDIGACSRIAAGSVVLHPVPPNTTMAGVPARAVGTAGCAEPSRSMNQILSQLAYDSFTYTI